MSNQVILWSMLIVPWLTLFFMERKTIKQFMPTALFSVVTSILMVEAGETFNWWIINETAYPFRTVSYLFGLNPVTTMWLLKSTYGRFKLYLAVDVVLNFGFVYLFLNYFLGNRGIFQPVGITALQNVLLASLHGVVIYVFQLWQEGIWSRSERKSFSTNLQPAAAKPLPKDQENKIDNE
ncbi:MAG: hypothetical protein H6Q69_1750 [Firmicutes bacterium]|nr:hypothetical protein [Bacillota bacterium]